MQNCTIYNGDSIQVLRTLPSESVHTVVTSPPYWSLRDYGVRGQLGLEATYQEYVNNLVAVFREVHRVLRRDGTLWLNLGDTYISQKEQSGQASKGIQETRIDDGTTLSRSYSHVAGKGKARPCDRRQDGLKRKDLVGIPWRVAFALQADGWYLRMDNIWAKKNCMPESVKDRPAKAHEYIFLLSKSDRYYYDYEAVRKPNAESTKKVSHRGRITFDAKYGGTDPKAQQAFKHVDDKGANLRSVWHIATKPYSAAHFATFPPKLIKPCVLAGCPENGVVLDPFGGAGTTGLVALRNNRNAILIDLNREYCEMAENRIYYDCPMFNRVKIGIPNYPQLPAPKGYVYQPSVKVSSLEAV